MFLEYHGRKGRLILVVDYLFCTVFFVRTDFVDSIHNVMYTATKVTRLPNATVIAFEKPVESSQQCMRLCANFGDGQQCLSFNYNSITQECRLYNETGRQGNGYKGMQQAFHVHHYDKSLGDPIRLP